MFALTSPDIGTFLAQDDNLGAHGFASLLDGQIALLINIDDGYGDVHASSTC